MELLEDVTQLYVKGRYENVNGAYEIKSTTGDIIMSADCHYRDCAGWPEERFTIFHPDGRWVIELKGESLGCCGCTGGKMDTEVRGTFENVIGLLKGQVSHILLSTSSNDLLGEIRGGLISSNKKIKLPGGTEGDAGKMVHESHATCQKFLVVFPAGCPSNIKVLIVAAALELVWKYKQDHQSM